MAVTVEMPESVVAIIGGGPVGLALAVELGTRNVPCVVVEPDPRTRLVPRAKLANVRTMEHMRRWGIADELRARSPLPADYTTDIAFVTTVFGHEITRFTNVFYTEHGRDPRFPEPAQQVPQYVMEPVLRRRAEACDAVGFLDGWRLESLAETADGVRLQISHEDKGYASFAAEYVVGCDGASSTVRSLLEIPLDGQHAMKRNYGIVFRSEELSRSLPLRPALHFWTVNADTPSYMGPANREGLWWIQATALSDSQEFDSLDPATLIRGALGRDVAPSIVAVDPWSAHALTAQRVREGRVFLAGDAAHLHTPMGAHGMNLGVGDGVDLGWKLAAVHEGWAGSALLDSYEMERHSLHRRITDEATRNYGLLSNNFVRDGLDANDASGAALRAALAGEIQRTKHREFFSLGLVLGSGFDESPIVVADASPRREQPIEPFVPLARTGVRAPHAWLGDGSSLFDRFGPHYTLLQLDQSVDSRPLVDAARQRQVPLRIVALDRPELRHLYGAGAALVRPDQVLAWRGEPPASADAARLIDVVTARLPAAA